MKTHGLLFVVCACMVMAGLSAHAADPIGAVVALEGTATATGEDGATRDLATKSPVYMKDVIRTMDGSKLQVMFTDDSVVSQGPNGEMTIDEYVFNPAKKEDNKASVGLVKGVFRMVTGKITKMNPEQFGVRTRMATIGIRGCDLGFRVTEGGDDIYIIELHGKENVVVQSTGEAKGVWQGLIEEKWDAETAKKKLMNILNSGMIVSIKQDGEMGERELSSDELGQLLDEVTPEGGLTGGGGGGDGSGGEGVGAEGEGDGTGAEGEGDGTGTEGAGADGTGEDAGDGTGLLDGATDENGATDGLDSSLDGWGEGSGLPDGSTDLGGDLTTDGTDTSLDDQYDPSVQPPTPPQDEFTGDTSTADTGTGDTSTPDTGTGDTGTGDTGGGGGGTSVFVSQGSSTDWEWGVWETDGNYDSIEVFSPNNNVLSSSDFDTLETETIRYLSGTGDAGALVNYAGERRLVTGSCSIDVTIGGNNVTTWLGSFGMSNDQSDSLDFDASGTIQAGNNLVGNLDSYGLTVNGASFGMGDVTDESIDGQLLGDGGTPPITGVMGTVYIDNNNGQATVHGVFATDLAE